MQYSTACHYRTTPKNVVKREGPKLCDSGSPTCTVVVSWMTPRKRGRDKRDAATKDSHRATASRRPKGLSFQYSSFPVVLSPLPHRDPSTVCASPSFSSLVRPSPRPPAGCLRTAHSLSRHGAVGLGAICTVCLPTTSLLYALSSCLVSHSFLFLVRIFFLPISFFKCYIFSFFFSFPWLVWLRQPAI